jgi:cold shock protein
MERATGKVKWFSQEKGYGFITREDGSDVFVHYSSVQGNGVRTLEQGEPVEFDVIEEPKGMKAQNVTRTDVPAAGAAPDPWATPGGSEAAGGWNRASRDW